MFTLEQDEMRNLYRTSHTSLAFLYSKSSEHLSSPPVFGRDRVTRSLLLYVCFVDRCLSFWPFSFGHYVVCSSSIYGFWLPLWYLLTLLEPIDSPPITNKNWYWWQWFSPNEIWTFWGGSRIHYWHWLRLPGFTWVG